MIPAETGKPTRVLIVDDEPDIETLVRRRYKHRNGFEFVFARSGTEAIEQLESDPTLDVVVTDINMPGMDGLSLIGKLGELDGRIVKAVILSAYGDLGNIRSAMNRGAFDFLTKPIDFQDFETTLQRTRDALHLARRGHEAREQLNAIEQELEIAARIQTSILPREFLPGRRDFGVYAEMMPARRVGGDFYDFFLIDEERLGFVIGDVSGKGIPAALFMAVSRTLLQAIALRGVAPAECFEYANRVLGRQGEPGVYVTMFYGILHTGTGALEYCIGGHNPPYRITAGGEVGMIAEPGGMVVGLLPEGGYETGTLQLKAGETVVLFTDGVTEAMDAGQHFFGERRLKEVLVASAMLPPESLVKAALSAVAEFTADAPQNDDITMLAVKWIGPAIS